MEMFEILKLLPDGWFFYLLFTLMGLCGLLILWFCYQKYGKIFLWWLGITVALGAVFWLCDVFGWRDNLIISYAETLYIGQIQIVMLLIFLHGCWHWLKGVLSRPVVYFYDD